MPKACVDALLKKTNPATDNNFTEEEAHKICYSTESKRAKSVDKYLKEDAGKVEKSQLKEKLTDYKKPKRSK